MDFKKSMEELRYFLGDYYFNNPLPEDDTDDVDLLEQRAEKRVRWLSDKEVLEEIVKLYKLSKLNSK